MREKKTKRLNAAQLGDALVEAFVGRFKPNGNAPYWAMEFKLNLDEIDVMRLDEQLDAHGYFRLVTGPKNEVCRLVKGYGAVCAYAARTKGSEDDAYIKNHVDLYYQCLTSEQEVLCFTGELAKQNNFMGGFEKQ